MSNARRDFYSTLSSFAHALESPDVISRDLTDTKHNERARLLRNGLAVTGFAMVEEFIKQRTGEILEKIGHTSTPFNELPDGLQKAAIEGVIAAIQFQAKLIPRNDLPNFYQIHAKSTASTLTSPYQISPIAFCNNYTNLSSKETENILEAFRIETPWVTLSAIINRLAVGVLAPKQAFDDAATRRHASAHVSNTNTQYSSLEAYKIEAISFCLAYDLLVSKALRLIVSRDNNYLIRKAKITNKSLDIRYIRESGINKWKEQKAKDNNPREFRTIKNSDDFTALKTDCLRRGRQDEFAVIYTTQSGVPIEWFTPYLD